MGQLKVLDLVLGGSWVSLPPSGQLTYTHAIWVSSAVLHREGVARSSQVLQLVRGRASFAQASDINVTLGGSPDQGLSHSLWW